MSFFDRFRSVNKHWSELSTVAQLDELITESKTKPVAIFKHSTSCGTSNMVKDQLDDAWKQDHEEVKFYYLDLLANRGVSNEVARRFKVVHQSPQMILLKNGRAVYDSSHMSIDFDQVLKKAGPSLV